jgi:hypothetical protein
MHELIETEKEFDRLSIVKPGQTSTSWAINVRIPLQELWVKKGKLSVYHQYCLFAGEGEIVNSRNYRPKIHKNCMAICFYCWKLVKINDKRGCIKAAGLLKDHWDHSCKIPRTKDRSACIIQTAYRNYRKRPTSFIKRVWEEVRNDDTPKEKKFLGMLGKEVIYSINMGYSSSISDYNSYGRFNSKLRQYKLYHQKSYSEHKRCQLWERLSQA